MFNERAGVQFRNCLAELLLRIHDDRTVPGHRFFDRLTGDQQESNAVRTGLHADLVSAIKEDE